MVMERRRAGVKAVIFDCDGVMFDSREANEAYYNTILAQFGKPEMDTKQAEYVHMNTATQSVAYLFQGDSRLSEALAFREAMSYTRFIPMMRMEPHLRTLLPKLNVHYKTAVATNRSDTMTAVLEEHGLSGAFDLVVSSLDVRSPKPAPDALVKILTHFDIDSREAVYVGDSKVDELTADAAQVPFIAYKNPQLSADRHMNHFKELEAWLFSEGE